MSSNEKIFTPGINNWILAVSVGIVAPLLAQTFIANLINQLSLMPEIIAGTIVENTTHSQNIATIILSIIALVYVYVNILQMRYLTILKSHKSVIALFLTTTGPFIIWFLAPIVLEIL